MRISRGPALERRRRGYRSMLMMACAEVEARLPLLIQAAR